jgi:hypothetical protein|tara:strand:+ start:292 stop:450 length:159 start_codon:yes stop_codon:yes gene_type:complete
MSVNGDNFVREEYNTQLLEEIRDLLRLLAAMFEAVHETGLENDGGEDVDHGI